MIYQQYAPPPPLKRLVRYFWSYKNFVADGRLEIKSFADQYPRFIFQDPDFEPLHDKTKGPVPICYVSGIDTRPTTASMKSAFSHFGVSFYPYALPVFFRIGADQLTNETPELSLLGSYNIASVLAQCQSDEDKIAKMCGFLLELMGNSPGIDPALIHFFGNGNYPGEKNAERGFKAHKISERQFQRMFKYYVGVSQRKFNCIERFQSALSRLGSAAYSELTGIAYELGYTDQSHFINEFKEFSGMSPYAFVKSNRIGSESASFIYQQ